jgi:hypothetical protein
MNSGSETDVVDRALELVKIIEDETDVRYPYGDDASEDGIVMNSEVEKPRSNALLGCGESRSLLARQSNSSSH